MSKELLRKKYLQIRNDITDKDEKSAIIFKKIVSCAEYKKAKTIGIYMSLKNEVDTSKIIEDALKQEKTVLIPKIEGENLHFYKYNFGDFLVKNKFGIFEPNVIEIPSNDKMDLCIIPGVCFDLRNNRIRFWKRILR